MPETTDLTHIIDRWSEVFMRRSMREFREFTRRTGLSMPQIAGLHFVAQRGGCGVSDFGGHLSVTSAAASQHIDRLVQLGLLQRAEDPADRRNKTIALTEQGRRVVEDSVQARSRWMAGLAVALTPQQQTAVAQALTVLTEAALRQESAAPDSCP